MPDPDLAARLASLHRAVDYGLAHGMRNTTADLDLLAELFRQRGALAAALEEARAELDDIRERAHDERKESPGA
jgi:hypothetical protein